MKDKPYYSEIHGGWKMDSKTVYIFECPNCGKEYIYPLGRMVRWCKECGKPKAKENQ